MCSSQCGCCDSPRRPRRRRAGRIPSAAPAARPRPPTSASPAAAQLGARGGIGHPHHPGALAEQTAVVLGVSLGESADRVQPPVAARDPAPEPHRVVVQVHVLLPDPDRGRRRQPAHGQVQAGAGGDQHATVQPPQVRRQLEIGEQAEVAVPPLARRHQDARHPAQHLGRPRATAVRVQRGLALRRDLVRQRPDRHRRVGVEARGLPSPVDADDLDVMPERQRGCGVQRGPDGAAHRVGVHEKEVDVHVRHPRPRPVPSRR